MKLHANVPLSPKARQRLIDRRDRHAEIAGRHDATPAQVALAWLLARSPIMLPNPGTGSVAHLHENVDAAELVLDEPDLQKLDAAA